ncbi:hypothetical protein D3C73_1480530 [compost metagenome]
MERCKNIAVQSLGLFIPNDLKPYLAETIDSSIMFGENAHELFSPFANDTLYRELLNVHIIS